MSLATQIVTDLEVIMTIAAVVTFVFHRLRQPLVLGYLIAGIIIGPYTPPFSLISRIDFLEVGAELGVILLLFGIGLEFPIIKLRKVAKVTTGVAAIEIVFMLFISYLVATMLGWSFMDGIFLGAALASSSTTIIAKALSDLGKINEVSSLIMLGVLVIEDLAVVLMLALLESLGTIGQITFETVGFSLAKIVIFLVGSLVVGGMVVPRFIDKIAETRRSEVLILAALGLCFGLSILANRLGFSVAIGAFLMGVIVANSKSAEQTALLISPLKDMFAAMFFVSVGALIDVTQFQTFLIPAIIITLAMISAKILGCGLGTRIFGYDSTTSLRVGLGMAQIGEFAFIVMRIGQNLDVISQFLFPIIGVVAGITTFLTPYLIKLGYEIQYDRP